jgi:hypothetical protein
LSFAALALGASLLVALAARPARAWEYPLLPHVNGLAFFPETPNSAAPVTALLSAYYPNECWQLVDTVLTDSVHVRVTVKRVEGCADTVSGWTHAFQLGAFTAGMHDLNVHCTVVEPGKPDAEEEITVPFEVVEWSTPPPSYSLPLLEIIEGTEAHPGEPVTLTLRGFTPFECTLIHDEHTVGQTAVYAAFDVQASCTDTTRRWTRSFGLGTFAEGEYPVDIHLIVSSPDSSHDFVSQALVRVHPPAPPPPPVDSSSAGVSSSHPNPFREQSSFSVSLDTPQSVDVGVFDVLGRRVVTIHKGMLPQGTSQLAWNGRRQDGSRAPGGIYFYRLTLQDRVIHRQVVLLGTP